MSDVVFKETEKKMSSAIDTLKREFGKLRVGKATPSLLDGIAAEAYGAPTPINQLATIGTPEPRLLIVQPWDKKLIAPIEKAIRASGLGLNPASDGQVIRVPIPALSEERRKELVRVAKGYAEEGRVALRIVLRDANDSLKKEHKAGKLTQDEEKRAHDRIQELTDRFVKEVDTTLSVKEKEILEI
jgi:ribosome recycling factor